MQACGPSVSTLVIISLADSLAGCVTVETGWEGKGRKGGVVAGTQGENCVKSNETPSFERMLYPRCTEQNLAQQQEPNWQP